MTQKEINERWHPVLVDLNGATVKSPLISQPKRENKPAYLEPPFEYEAPIDKVRELYWSLKGIAGLEAWRFRIFDVDTAHLEGGRRLSFEVQADPPDFVKGKSGVTEAAWNTTTGRMKELLEVCLGECPVYIEPWTPTAQFRARFIAYIKFLPY